MTFSRILRCFLLLAFLSNAFAADITGKWKGPMSQGGQAVFTLKTEGDSVSGTMLGEDGKEKAIRSGKLKGDAISFSVDSDWQGTPLTLLVKGTVSGNEMHLRIDADNGYWGTDAVVKRQ
jgi:hypothetical protein